MDTLAPTSRKSAAKCDTSCELQGSANHEILERTLRPRARPEACLFERRLTVINIKTPSFNREEPSFACWNWVFGKRLISLLIIRNTATFGVEPWFSRRNRLTLNVSAFWRSLKKGSLFVGMEDFGSCVNQILCSARWIAREERGWSW